MRAVVAIVLAGCALQCSVQPKPAPEKTPAPAAKPVESLMCDYFKDGSVVGRGASGPGPEYRWKTVLRCPSGKIEDVPYTDKEKAEMREADDREERHRRELIWALRTRILTNKEMAEVMQRGEQLLVTPWTQFNKREVEWEVEREFNDLLLQQFRMRAITGEARGRE